MAADLIVRTDKAEYTSGDTIYGLVAITVPYKPQIDNKISVSKIKKYSEVLFEASCLEYS